MTYQNRTNKLFHLVMTALLLAIVVVLQLIGGYIKIAGTSISLVLIPIVIGSVSLGAGTGMFLGLAFGLMTVIAGVSGQDFFTATLMQYEPVFTVLVCLVKAGLAGLVPGLIWKCFKEKNEFLAILLASASAPIVNTGIFIAGGLLFFGDALSKAGFLGEDSLIYFLVIGCAGLNFIAEFGANIIFTPAIQRIIKAFNHR